MTLSTTLVAFLQRWEVVNFLLVVFLLGRRTMSLPRDEILGQSVGRYVIER